MPSWLPVQIEADDKGNRWCLHLTVLAGQRAGLVLRYADFLMKEGKGEPMARRKLHGILGRQVDEAEWADLEPWELEGYRAWALVEEVRDDYTGRHVQRVQLKYAEGEPAHYLGWQPEWFMDYTLGDDEAWAYEAANADFDDLHPKAWGFRDHDAMRRARQWVMTDGESMGYELMDQFQNSDGS